ncbi:stage II sporulation protein P [Evansella sp. AB-P1]|uniref:stage II sporulation protein P n=1 Tax=Evansella sp. AB-P1 TaxID=3037653 RepID=UPI00241FE083|nr:stage II sporulation protein P [Evansella sp. AB-P1]MDG5786527.1 stage II sporulation protein P [Evansella sp. AB-P1]
MKKHRIRNKRRINQWNRTSIKSGVFSTVFGVIGLFFLIALLTAFGPSYSLSSASINEASRNLSNEMFVYMMGMENQYFTQSLPEDASPPSITATAFQLATSINPQDHRSLLGRELPGFALFDGRIIVAGEGVDYTQMPIESAPPMEVLLAEREAAEERLEEMDKLREEMANQEELDNVVHIMHSHNRESFFPELNIDDDSNASLANHGSVNITLAGERLGMELAKYGIGSIVDTSDISSKLNDRGWQFVDSYRMSRQVLESDIEEHGGFEFYFDLHRDAQRRETTTVEINGEMYAKILFVVGSNNPNYEQNEQVKKELHSRIEEDYPGLSRGVFDPVKAGGNVNGVYNQDMSPNSILVEFGGVDNSLEEVYRSVEVFAEIFSEYYFELKATEDEG